MAGLDINKLWKLLSPRAKNVGTILGGIYSDRGTFRFDLTDLERNGLGTLTELLFSFYELESRDFGRVSGDMENPIFTLNRPKFETLFGG